MALGGHSVGDPIGGSRRPGVAAVETQLAIGDRLGRGQRRVSGRWGAAGDRVPEALFGIEQVILVHPVRGDLIRFPAMVAVDHREDRALDATDSHIMLELRHIAHQHLVGLGKGRDVLGFPHRPTGLDKAIKRRPTPGVGGRRPDRACVADLQTGDARIPLPVEGLGPTAKHNREDGGEVLTLALAALLSPERTHAVGITGQDDVGIAASDPRQTRVALGARQAKRRQGGPSCRRVYGLHKQSWRTDHPRLIIGIGCIGRTHIMLHIIDPRL